MSQYFAKLLVVGGDDIKDGDYYLFDGKINKCYKSIIPELKQFYGEEWDSNWYQKVKLFICTRNIQVGDTLKECMPDGKEYTVHHFECVLPCGVYVMNPWPSENEVWIHADKAFKVIGEVSAEATWVREGLQFNEEEIKDILKTA